MTQLQDILNRIHPLADHMFTKPLVLVVISFLVVALIHNSFAPFANFIANAVPPDPIVSGGTCEVRPDGLSRNCCWTVKFLESDLKFCQGCRKTETGFDDCDPVYRASGPVVPLQEGGVLEDPLTSPSPTPSPTSPLVRPPIGGVFDPPKASSPFGPTEGIFDPPKASPPTGPIFPVSPTLPIPPTTPQEDGSGPLKPQGGGILQQPEEVEDPEDEGENEEEEGSSNGDQGQETAGPLT